MSKKVHNCFDVVAKSLMANGPVALRVASYIIAACSAVSAVTPTPVDDGVFMILHKVVSALALNIDKKAYDEGDYADL